jgi:hypothetical protein
MVVRRIEKEVTGDHFRRLNPTICYFRFRYRIVPTGNLMAVEAVNGAPDDPGVAMWFAEFASGIASAAESHLEHTGERPGGFRVELLWVGWHDIDTHSRCVRMETSAFLEYVLRMHGVRVPPAAPAAPSPPLTPSPPSTNIGLPD